MAVLLLVPNLDHLMSIVSSVGLGYIGIVMPYMLTGTTKRFRVVITQQSLTVVIKHDTWAKELSALKYYYQMTLHLFLVTFGIAMMIGGVVLSLT